MENQWIEGIEGSGFKVQGSRKSEMRNEGSGITASMNSLPLEGKVPRRGG